LLPKKESTEVLVKNYQSTVKRLTNKQPEVPFVKRPYGKALPRNTYKKTAQTPQNIAFEKMKITKCSRKCHKPKHSRKNAVVKGLHRNAQKLLYEKTLP